MKFTIGLIASSIFVFCSAPQVSISPTFEPKTKIETAKAKVRILDMRIDNIAASELVIPFNPYPGQNESQSAKLPDNLEALFSGKINSCLTGTGPEVEIQVLVNHARKGWSAGIAQKAELAEADFQITVVEPGSGQELLLSHVIAATNRPCSKITTATINEVFAANLMKTLSRFLLNQEEIKILNANLAKVAGNTPARAVPAAESAPVAETPMAAPVAPAAANKPAAETSAPAASVVDSAAAKAPALPDSLKKPN